MSKKAHYLKTWPDAFQAVWDRKKVHELRKDDRSFKEGDVLDLYEWDPQTESFTCRHIPVTVLHITKAGEFPGLREGYVVMSIAVDFRGMVEEGWPEENKHLFEKG